MNYLQSLALLLVSLCLTLTQGYALPKHQQEQLAEGQIVRLYNYLTTNRVTNRANRIQFISERLIGTPYLLGALGEGLAGKYDQSPLYRMDAFDCETYVDTVLALALANNFNQFEKTINAIRYKNGVVSFISRNHFTCLDWNKNNQQQGFLKDITPTIRDKNQKPVVNYARALINKSGWYNQFTPTTIKLAQPNLKLQTKRLKILQKKAQTLPRQLSTIPYIPLTALFDQQGTPNYYLFNQIPNAAIIEIIRPNWNMKDKIGTNLNVSHLGFAIRKQNILFFREASSNFNRVIDVPLYDYLWEAKKNPTIQGINIQIVPLSHIPHMKSKQSCCKRELAIAQ